MKVRATKKGYDNVRLRKPGEEFEVEDKLFSASWMERLDGPPPKRNVSAKLSDPLAGKDTK